MRRTGVEIGRRFAVRRAGEAHPRVQAPAPEPALRGDALSAHPARSRAASRAAHGDLRRQGGARLRHGEGHRSSSSTTSRAPSTPTPPMREQAAGGVPAGLRRVARAEDHAGRGSVAADIHRRHGSLGHRQHEARAQRARSPSARWTAPTSRSAIMSAPENIFIFGMTAEEAAARRAAGYQPWRELEGNPRARRGARSDRFRAISRRDGRTTRKPVVRRLLERRRAVSGARGFRRLCGGAGAAWMRCTRGRTNGAARRRSIA